MSIPLSFLPSNIKDMNFSIQTSAKNFIAFKSFYTDLRKKIDTLDACLASLSVPYLQSPTLYSHWVLRAWISPEAETRYLSDLNTLYLNITIGDALTELERLRPQEQRVLQNARCTVVENPYAPFSPSLESNSIPISVQTYNKRFKYLDADPRPFVFMNEFGITDTTRESALPKIQESIKNELLSPSTAPLAFLFTLFKKYGTSLYAISSPLFSWNAQTRQFDGEETITWWQVVKPRLPSQIYFYRIDKRFRDNDIDIAIRSRSKIADYIKENPLPSIDILVEDFPEKICAALNLPYAKMYSPNENSEYTNPTPNTQSVKTLDRRVDGSKVSTKKIADEKEIGTPTSSFTTGETSETTQDTTDLQDDTLKDSTKTPWYKTSLGIASLVLGVSALGFGAFHLMRKQKTTL